MATNEPQTLYPGTEAQPVPVTEPAIEHTTAHIAEPVVAEPTKAEPTESVTPVVAAAATETPTAAHEESAPKPNPSKSNTTKRLSLFLKSFVGEKKPNGPKSPVEENRAVVPQETALPEETEPESDHKIKSEKRKSILGGLFRSKSPVKEIEHNEAATPSVPPKDEAPVEATKVSEEHTAHTEHSTAPTAAVAATAAAAAATHNKEEHEAEEPRKEHKDNVIDQIKRSSIGKFFNKKKEVTKEESEDADHVASASEQDEPKTSRPSSPLGRSLTHLFRGKSTKKKTEDQNVDPVLDNPLSPTPINTVKVN
ncbi:hypothetical protein BY458DRAFT_496736 [Sporodiniella umbellata]|nr:hypothetical protein BY458DRAFT_496736 [Sporodiniella umbellata]